MTRPEGTFDITGTPQANTEGSEAVGAMRMVFRKTFHGPLQGTSVVEMMGIMYKESLSGAYVALEKITGTLDGRTGSFCMQHSSTMARGNPEQRITVVPDSGTGELADLSGSLTIDIVEKVHHYTFVYEFAG